MMKNASGTSSSRYSVPYRFKYVPHRMVERPVKSRRTIALVDCKRIPSFPLNCATTNIVHLALLSPDYTFDANHF